MSVLIKGIDLPEAYTSAWLTVFECVDGHTFVRTHKVSPEQMQAIPPHGHLIDADELMLEFAEYVRASNNSDFAAVPTWNDAVSLLGSAPTIIEAEEGEA